MMAPIENAQDLVLCYYQSLILFPLSLIIFFFSRRPDLLPPLAQRKLKKQMRNGHSSSDTGQVRAMHMLQQFARRYTKDAR